MKHWSGIVETSSSSILRKIHTDNSLVAKKCPTNVKWSWMEFNAWCIFSWNRWKSAELSKKSHKKVKLIIFENNNTMTFQWAVVHTNRTRGFKIRAIQGMDNWETKKMILARLYRPIHAQKLCKITRKCVKLIFTKWKP